MGGLAERGPELAAEVRRGHVGHPRQRWNVEGLGECPIHRVASTQHPPVAILDRESHLRKATASLPITLLRRAGFRCVRRGFLWHSHSSSARGRPAGRRTTAINGHLRFECGCSRRERGTSEASPRVRIGCGVAAGPGRKRPSGRVCPNGDKAVALVRNLVGSGQPLCGRKEGPSRQQDLLVGCKTVSAGEGMVTRAPSGSAGIEEEYGPHRAHSPIVFSSATSSGSAGRREAPDRRRLADHPTGNHPIPGRDAIRAFMRAGWHRPGAGRHRLLPTRSLSTNSPGDEVSGAR